MGQGILLDVGRDREEEIEVWEDKEGDNLQYDLEEECESGEGD